MEEADDHENDDGPPGRGTRGPPITEPGHRVRDTLISWAPDTAAWITELLAKWMPGGGG